MLLRRLVLSIVAILLVSVVMTTTAFAKISPSVVVSVDTGQTEVDLYGNTVAITNTAVVWLGLAGTGTVGDSPFRSDYVDSATSYPVFNIGGNSYVEAYSERTDISGFLRSGPDETKAYYKATFSLSGAGWGTMELSVFNGDFPTVLNMEMRDGDSMTYWFASAQEHRFTLKPQGAVTTPEPSSMIAVFSGITGLTGLAGFAGLIRRRRK